MWMNFMGKRGPSGSRSSGAASTGREFSPGITSSLCVSEDDGQRRLCRESSVYWRWRDDRSDKPNHQSRCSDCREFRSHRREGLICPRLPGQVPVEPTETSISPSVSPVNKSWTEKPSEFRKRKGIRSFFRSVWKIMKRHFLWCRHCRTVTVVEPFIPPSDPDPESDPEFESDPESYPQSYPQFYLESDPDHSGINTNNDSFESLYNVGEMIGSGTFGSVFKGTRKFDGKKVAIKRILKFDNFLYLDIPGHPEPLVTEVALLMMMRQDPISPFVIQLYEWFEHPGRFTLVLELPEPCESLLDFISRNPELHETVARLIMRQAVLAVN